MIDTGSREPVTIDGSCHCGAVGFNAACLKDTSPFDFPEVEVFDGERHPSDSPGGRSRVAGILRFEPAADA